MAEEKSDYHKFLEDADIGVDCETFLKSNVGQYIKACAEADEIRALKTLGNVDPDDKAKIVQLQIEAAVPRRFVEFLSRAITAGKNAQFALDQIDK